MGKRKDLTGQVVGVFQVLEFAETRRSPASGRSIVFWKVICPVCLQIATMRVDHLYWLQSCGCVLAKRKAEGFTKTHGESKTRLYKILKGLRRRCSTKPGIEHYANYAGRDIGVCEEWSGNIEVAFLQFKTWALSNGYSDELTLDRVDNDGPYSPGNSRWAPRDIQAGNKRNNRWVDCYGVWMLATHCEPFACVSGPIARRRIKKGWTNEEAYFTPPFEKPERFK